MSFQCKECGKDIEPKQAQDTYDEFERAMCAECVNRMLNENEERPEPEHATPIAKEEEPEIPAKEEKVTREEKPIVVPAKVPPKPATRKLSNEDLTKENIRQYLCPAATDQEIFMFLQLCEHRNLNPFIKEAYLVKYNNSPATLIVGKDAFTKKAEEHPQFDGFEAGVIVEVSGSIEYRPGQLVRKGEELIGGWAEVHRKDRQYPYRSEVSMQEYNTGQSSWKKLPATMIRKVALVQALREAFPSDLGGCYDSAEMGEVV
jgi:phage recombination protein Bet